jgi:hypothetical protein
LLPDQLLTPSDSCGRQALHPGVTSRISAAANADADVQLKEGDTINVSQPSFDCRQASPHHAPCLVFQELETLLLNG